MCSALVMPTDKWETLVPHVTELSVYLRNRTIGFPLNQAFSQDLSTSSFSGGETPGAFTSIFITINWGCTQKPLYVQARPRRSPQVELQVSTTIGLTVGKSCECWGVRVQPWPELLQWRARQQSVISVLWEGHGSEGPSRKPFMEMGSSLRPVLQD